MAVESLDQSRRQSDSTLPSMSYTSFERVAREGVQFQRSNPSDNVPAGSPVSPTTTTSYSSSFTSKYQQPAYTAPLTPPESRKNSEDEKRGQSLPSLREVGLAPTLNPAHTNGNGYHSHTSLPPVHNLPAVQQSQPPHSNGYQHPPPPSHSSEQHRYDYHDGRNSYSQGPGPVHPNPEPYQSRQTSYPQLPSGQYSRPHPPPSHSSFSGPPPPPGHQFSHGSNQQPSSNQPSYAPNPMPPPYGPYHHDSNVTHPPVYSQGGSPTSKVLGKRPSTGYGGAIERALDVSSMRRDLGNSRDRSLSIYNLVQQLYEQNGSGYQNHGLEGVVAEFNKAIRDADELKEGLEGCRKLLTDMCKEQEQQSTVEKGRPHIPEYEVEEHYTEDTRILGLQQPELKKVRRGRAAPPGRCHSCHRAETPEWRRGPDGARTLCNACGLHYAKLTRKMSKSNLAANAMARKSPNSSLS